MYFEDAVSDKWPQLVQVHAVDDESREELPTHAVLVNVSPLVRAPSVLSVIQSCLLMLYAWFVCRCAATRSLYWIFHK